MPDPNLTPFRGNSGNNTLASDRDGRDLYGLGGDDRLSGAFDRTALYGGSGRDWLRTVLPGETETAPPARLTAAQYGGDGADVLIGRLALGSGQAARLTQYGGAGDDRIDSQNQADAYGPSGAPLIDLYVNAGLGNDDIRATSIPLGNPGIYARHVISAHGGDDVIVSLMREVETGDTRIYGGAGDDVIDARIESSPGGFGSGTSNRIYGGDGDDTISAYASDQGGFEAMNLIFGGDGADVITAAIRTNTNVSSPVGASTVYGGAGADIITVDHVATYGNFASVLWSKVYGGDGGDYVEARAVAESEGARENVTNELWGEGGGDVLIAEALAGSDFNDADTFSVRGRRTSSTAARATTGWSPPPWPIRRRASTPSRSTACSAAPGTTRCRGRSPRAARAATCSTAAAAPTRCARPAARTTCFPAATAATGSTPAAQRRRYRAARTSTLSISSWAVRPQRRSRISNATPTG